MPCVHVSLYVLAPLLLLWCGVLVVEAVESDLLLYAQWRPSTRLWPPRAIPSESPLLFRLICTTAASLLSLALALGADRMLLVRLGRDLAIVPQLVTRLGCLPALSPTARHEAPMRKLSVGRAPSWRPSLASAQPSFLCLFPTAELLCARVLLVDAC